ncbi:YlmC/YmxH family sporulation protein [Peptococcaceae bacterium 1198_IL3148]
MVKISELRTREIINVVDGRRLGVIKDIDINMEDGKISALILPGTGRFMGLWGKDDEFVVPWEKIVKVGMDVILVEVNVMSDRHEYLR